MNQLTLIVVVLVVYMAAMLLIGWLGRSKSDNFDEYVTAAKKGSFLWVCGSYIGSHIGNGCCWRRAKWRCLRSRRRLVWRRSMLELPCLRFCHG